MITVVGLVELFFFFPFSAVGFQKIAIVDSQNRITQGLGMEVVSDAFCSCSLSVGRLCQSNFACAGAAACPGVESDVLYNGYPEEAGVRDRLSLWKPLVLLIPLRLGLTEINEAYIETLKVGDLELNS